MDVQAWTAAGGDARKLALYGAIGRVAVFAEGSDRCLAAVHPALPHVGAVGDWVGGDAVRKRAETWLGAQGCVVLRGPMELCTWFPYRANLGPFDEAPFALEPVERADRWLAAGYAPVASYTSQVVDSTVQIEGARARRERLLAAGWGLEPLPRGPDGRVPPDDFAAAVAIVHRLSSVAFTEAYAFAPIPEAALQAVYAPYRDLVDPDLCLLARAPDGSVGAFVFAIPDVARPDRRWFLVKTLAVLPEHRQHGLGSVLTAETHRIGRDKGFAAGVHCLMWTESFSTQLSVHGGTVFRRYALLEKPLRWMA